MLKFVELADPQSCLNRAKEGEMIFVLLARDEAAPVALRAWAAERIRIGKNTEDDEQIKDALAAADAMEVQQAIIRKALTS